MPELPTGTVTFLLTDVEGSTRLWEEHPVAMRQTLARHDALIEAGVVQHGGQVVRPRGEGDSRFAVFARASDAVAAAAAIQQALRAEEWPAPIQLHVRIALHTGEADLRQGDYYGSAVNRCARLRAVAHGDQVLLSQATYDLIRDNLPPGVSLRDLGEHRLKDLIRPEHIFQLSAVDLPADFPALKTLDNRPNNLPLQQTALIGRERELDQLEALARRPVVRLITLTGPGGTGKTLLALQVAADLLDDFPDGVYFVDLAPISNPQLVLPTIAQALGLRESGGQPLRDTVAGFLRDKRLLLVLDNFEQVVRTASVVQDLLKGAAALKVLVTSRVVLRLYGEQEYPVPPLAVPAERPVRSVEVLSQYAAVALFITRAQLVKPDFTVTNETAPAVAEICVRLDGLPLAIELAAARSKVLSPHALLGRLDSRLRLLTGGARDLPARHQTLRAAIDWSYQLLDAGEQTLFAYLSVFVGGCTLEAAEAVCARAGNLPLDVLDGLSSLVDKSLLRQEEYAASAEPRFLMLDTIREYAVERLVQSGAESELRAAHAQHFLALAEEAEPQLLTAQQPEWLGRLEAEYDNLRAVLHWAQDSGDVLLELRMVGALWRFWDAHGYLSEGWQWLERALATTSAGTPARSGVGQELAVARARALHGAGHLAYYLGDYGRATALHEESLALHRELGDQRGSAYSLNNLGLVAWAKGDYGRAAALCEEGLALHRELGDKWGSAYSLMNLGNVSWAQSDYRRATSLYEESLVLFREMGEQRGIAYSLNSLGLVAWAQSDYRRAAVLHEESLALYRRLGDRWSIAYCLDNLGNVAHYQEDYGRAAALIEEGLALHRELGDKWGSSYSLNNLGHVAWAQGSYERAAVLHEEGLALHRELGDQRGSATALNNLGNVAHDQGDYRRAAILHAESLAHFRELGEQQGIACGLEGLASVAGAPDNPAGDQKVATLLLAAAAALRTTIGAPLHPVERAHVERAQEATRAALGPDEFAAAWAVGETLPLEEVITLALGGAPLRHRVGPAAEPSEDQKGVRPAARGAADTADRGARHRGRATGD